MKLLTALGFNYTRTHSQRRFVTAQSDAFAAFQQPVNYGSRHIFRPVAAALGDHWHRRAHICRQPRHKIARCLLTQNNVCATLLQYPCAMSVIPPFLILQVLFWR